MFDGNKATECDYLISTEEERRINQAKSLAIKEMKNWIENVTGHEFEYPNDFQKSLANGVLLCNLLNTLKPGSIKRVNRISTPIARYESSIDNIGQFLKCCEEDFGLSLTILFEPTDLDISVVESSNTCLAEKKLLRVLLCLFHLAQSAENSLTQHNINPASFKVLMQGQDIREQRRRTSTSTDMETSSESFVPRFIQTQQQPDYLAEKAQETINRTKVNKELLEKSYNDEDWQERLHNWREKRRQASSLGYFEETAKPEINDKELLDLKEKARQMKEFRDRIRLQSLPDENISFTTQSSLVTNNNQAEQALTECNSIISMDDRSTFVVPSIDEETRVMIEKLKRKKQQQDAERRLCFSPVQDQDLFNSDSEEHSSFTESNGLTQQRSFLNRSKEATEPIVAVPKSNYSESHKLEMEEDVTNLSNLRKTDIKLFYKSKHDKESMWGLELEVTQRRVMVKKVKIGSCADMCDIKAGDQIVAINEAMLENVTTVDDVISVFYKQSDCINIGDHLTLKILRDKEDEMFNSDLSEENEELIMPEQSIEQQATIMSSESKDVKRTKTLEDEGSRKNVILKVSQLNFGGSIGSDEEDELDVECNDNENDKLMNEDTKQPDIYQELNKPDKIKNNLVLSSSPAIVTAAVDSTVITADNVGSANDLSMNVKLCEKSNCCEVKGMWSTVSTGIPTDSSNGHTASTSAKMERGKLSVQEKVALFESQQQKQQQRQPYFGLSKKLSSNVERGSCIQLNTPQPVQLSVSTHLSNEPDLGGSLSNLSNYYKHKNGPLLHCTPVVSKKPDFSNYKLLKQASQPDITEANFCQSGQKVSESVTMETAELDLDLAQLNVSQTGYDECNNSDMYSNNSLSESKVDDSITRQNNSSTSDDISALNESIMIPLPPPPPPPAATAAAAAAALSSSSQPESCKKINVNLHQPVSTSIQTHFMKPNINKTPPRITTITTAFETPKKAQWKENCNSSLQCDDNSCSFSVTKTPNSDLNSCLQSNTSKPNVNRNPENIIKMSSSEMMTTNCRKRHNYTPSSSMESSVTCLSEENEKSVEIEVSVTPKLFPMKQKTVLLSKEKTSERQENLRKLNNDQVYEEKGTLKPVIMKTEESNQNYFSDDRGTNIVHKNAEMMSVGQLKSKNAFSLPSKEDLIVPLHRQKQQNNPQNLDYSEISVSTIPAPSQFGSRSENTISVVHSNVKSRKSDQLAHNSSKEYRRESDTKLTGTKDKSRSLSNFPNQEATIACQDVDILDDGDEQSQQQQKSVSYSDRAIFSTSSHSNRVISNKKHQKPIVISNTSKRYADRNLSDEEVNNNIVKDTTYSNTRTKVFSIDRSQGQAKEKRRHYMEKDEPQKKSYHSQSLPSNNKSENSDKSSHSCSYCGGELKTLGSEDLMVIEELNLYFHLRCFRCSECNRLLGDGKSDIDVRIRRSKLHCSDCYAIKSRNKNTSDGKSGGSHHRNNHQSLSTNQNQVLSSTTNQKPINTISTNYNNNTKGGPSKSYVEYDGNGAGGDGKGFTNNQTRDTNNNSSNNVDVKQNFIKLHKINFFGKNTSKKESDKINGTDVKKNKSRKSKYLFF